MVFKKNISVQNCGNIVKLIFFKNLQIRTFHKFLHIDVKNTEKGGYQVMPDAGSYTFVLKMCSLEMPDAYWYMSSLVALENQLDCLVLGQLRLFIMSLI